MIKNKNSSSNRAQQNRSAVPSSLNFAFIISKNPNKAYTTTTATKKKKAVYNPLHPPSRPNKPRALEPRTKPTRHGQSISLSPVRWAPAEFPRARKTLYSQQRRTMKRMLRARTSDSIFSLLYGEEKERFDGCSVSGQLGRFCPPISSSRESEGDSVEYMTRARSLYYVRFDKSVSYYTIPNS